VTKFKKKKKKCSNNKKEIYNDKYRHTRDRLFGLGGQLILHDQMYSCCFVD